MAEDQLAQVSRLEGPRQDGDTFDGQMDKVGQGTFDVNWIVWIGLKVGYLANPGFWATPVF